MKIQHKEFLKSWVVFSILFWGVYFLGVHVIPWISYYYLSTPDVGYIEMLERIPQLDESKL